MIEWEEHVWKVTRKREDRAGGDCTGEGQERDADLADANRRLKRATRN